MKNTCRVAKSTDGIEWIEVGNVDARSRGEAIATARRRDKSADAHWRTTLVACRTGRNLGKMVSVIIA